MAERVTLELDRIATGGEAVGRGDDGRVVFVAGVLPGERVTVEITEDRKRYRRGQLVSIERAADHRVEPPCDAVAAGCGGCDWQHVRVGRQPDLRRQIVVDTLSRLGQLGPERAESLIRTGPSLAATGYRTVLRAAVEQGRAGFRQARSHEVIGASACVIAHPLAAELLADGRFGPASEVRIVIGARTGERMVVVDGDPSEVSVPDDVLIVGPGGDGAIHEEVAGHRFRISARSFFQCRPDGADALVAAVHEAVEGVDGPLADLYAGVGLFAATVGAGRAVTAVEWGASSVADARHNVPWAEVVRQRTERWRPDEPPSVVVADPARRGLAAQGVQVIARTGADRIALVSCEPAALARDTGLLVGAGYEPVQVTLIDLFGHTSHIETVTRFDRA